MKWYNVKNSINNLSISIDEEIGSFGVNAKDFIEEVQSNGSKNIELTINSGGGSVFEAFAIYDYLKTSNLNQIGFIAQELEEIYPELVYTSEINGIKSVSYSNITPILVEAVKELKIIASKQQKIIDKLLSNLDISLNEM